MPPRTPPTQTQPSSGWGLSRIQETYAMLWKMIIRPPRDNYSSDELGPPRFRLGKRVCERVDLQLQGSRGTLECSHFAPAKERRGPGQALADTVWGGAEATPPERRRPCVIYLHGNCSSRLEAFDVLPALLSRGLSVFCLDLSGSGRSEGDYISLGYHEERDLDTAIGHLRSSGAVGRIALWGRSMGATTSILRCAEDHGIAACVLDSPFCNLRLVAEELVSRGQLKLPQFLVNIAFEVIRNEVLSRADFDPADLVPLEKATKATCPAFFGVAADDCFVLPHHTEDLHNSWGGERDLRVFDGSHNGVRPKWFLEEAADFLLSRLCCNGVISPPPPQPEAMRRDDSETDVDVPADRVDPSIEPGDCDESDAMDMPASAPGLRLFEQLRYLGFDDRQCQAAVRRCLTVDRAVEWLTTQDVTVQL